MRKIEYPNINGSGPAEQVRQIERFLRGLVDQINMELEDLEEQIRKEGS